MSYNNADYNNPTCHIRSKSKTPVNKDQHNYFLADVTIRSLFTAGATRGSLAGEAQIRHINGQSLRSYGVDLDVIHVRSVILLCLQRSLSTGVLGETWYIGPQMSFRN
jgi:hypothetical protein